VNTARGGLIDEAALADALRSGKLRAAGLDSFQVEPFSPATPFTGIANAILSPHIGGVTSDAYVGMGTAAARNWQSWNRAEPSSMSRHPGISAPKTRTDRTNMVWRRQ
jgi:phosphoglycerate dehydrogenase-like enzyme